MNPTIQFNPALAEAQKRGAMAEKALWDERLEALIERCAQEILHVQAFCKSQGYVVAAPYIAAIKRDYEAQGNLIKLSIARFQSQIEVIDAAIQEAQKQVRVPGPFRP